MCEQCGEELTHPISKQDLFDLGLSGCDGSREKRQALLKALDLPSQMSTNAMMQALSILYSKEELKRIVDDL